MAITADELKSMIEKYLPDAVVNIEDLQGDGEHYAAHVKSNRFKGLTRVEQHKLVYNCLGDTMAGSLHALRIITEIPN